MHLHYFSRAGDDAHGFGLDAVFADMLQIASPLGDHSVPIAEQVMGQRPGIRLENMHHYFRNACFGWFDPPLDLTC